MTSTDINECMEGTGQCDNNARCINTVGDYNCTCNSGYEGNGFLCSSKFSSISADYLYD